MRHHDWTLQQEVYPGHELFYEDHKNDVFSPAEDTVVIDYYRAGPGLNPIFRTMGQIDQIIEIADDMVLRTFIPITAVSEMPARDGGGEGGPLAKYTLAKGDKDRLKKLVKDYLEKNKETPKMKKALREGQVLLDMELRSFLKEWS